MKTKIYRADLYGLRENKYQYLSENDVSSTQWQEVNARTPFYLFVGQDQDVRDEYEKGWQITDVMPTHTYGFKTHRDHFAVDFSSEVLEKRIQEMRGKNLNDEEFRSKYDVRDNRDWQLNKAREQLRNDQSWQQYLVNSAYRPFDNRPCYFSTVAMDYPRVELTTHIFQKENFCLAASRQTSVTQYRHVFVTKLVPNDCLISNITKESNHNFPLYLYPNTSNDLFSQATNNPGGRRPNLSEKFIAEVSSLLELSFTNDGRGDLQKTFGPEDVFYYLYAVFHSLTYRERYAEFLKIDFPRVPLTKNLELFRELVALGEKLVKLHLMETRGKTMSRFVGRGDNLVDKPRFEDSKVYINKTQYFEGVPVEAWNFYVGGYQVCEKWLKDRKGRTLSFDDIKHYNTVVSNLYETIVLMGQIDEAINKQCSFPLA
jgi:predicted helicase